MGNTFLTPSVVAAEALLALENAMGMAATVHAGYSKEFKKVGNTVTIRKPAIFTAIEFDGDLTGQYQDITEQSITISLDTILTVPFVIGAKELTLSVKNLRSQILDPAMMAISQALDYKLTGLYTDIYNYITYDATSEATKLANLADIGAVLNANKAPFENRFGMLDETTHAGLVVVPSFMNAEKSGSTQTLRKASLGELLGVNWYMNQNVRPHAIGTTDLAGAATNTEPVGETSIVLDSLGTGTIKKGTIITFAGDTERYVVTADVAISGNAATVVIDRGLVTAVSSTTVVTLVGAATTAAENLVYHKNTFALAFAPIEPPLGGARGVSITWRGLPLQMVWDYIHSTMSNICSISFLCGVKTIMPELGARLTKTS